jgi:hypothetical protein
MYIIRLLSYIAILNNMSICLPIHWQHLYMNATDLHTGYADRGVRYEYQLSLNIR